MRPHPFHPNVYVTDDGRVFAELGGDPGYGGYHYVTIPGEARKTRRHTIVCETFHGLRPEKGVVRHLNGVAGDDRPENLQWGTQADNMQDAVMHGTTTSGERNARSKLTDGQVLELRRRWIAGERNKDLAEEFGIHKITLADLLAGRTWKHLPLTGQMN